MDILCPKILKMVVFNNHLMTKGRRNFLKAIATGSVISTSGCVGILAPEEKGKIGRVKIGFVYTINRVGDDKISVEKEGERMKVDKGLLGGPDWVFSRYGPSTNNKIEKVIYYYSYKHSVREHISEQVFATFENYLRLAEEMQPAIEDTEVTQGYRG